MEDVDAYLDYWNLVGGTDRGVTLSEAEYKALRQKADDVRKNSLFVYWRHRPTGTDCHNVGPSTPCFCRHRYREHAWFETSSKKVRCRMPGCGCQLFNYIPVQGSRDIKCRCKHSWTDHDPVKKRCNKCSCSQFHSTLRCGGCDNPWVDHETAFETAEERSRLGKPAYRGFMEAAPSAAALGGITGFLSTLDEPDPKTRFADHEGESDVAK
eukprot:Lankesteria_metandrocarpae@DN4943_c0_g1_i2.p1